MDKAKLEKLAKEKARKRAENQQRIVDRLGSPSTPPASPEAYKEEPEGIGDGHTGTRTHGHPDARKAGRMGTRKAGRPDTQAPAFMVSPGRTWQAADGTEMIRKTVHFPAPVLEAVQARAKAERRTFSQLIMRAVEAYLKGRE